ncbi:MAG: peptidoglycan-binding domain-containing protein [bacterium]
MKTISKIAAIALVAVALVGVNTASAATVAELQAMIASLSAQIAALSGTPSTPAAVTFTSNLTVGSKGAEVTALQNFLIGKGYNTLATGYFGPMTKAALAAYQTAKGITPAAGYFGPLTRTSVNGESVVVVPPTPGTTPGSVVKDGTDGSLTASQSSYVSSGIQLKKGDTKNVLAVRLKATSGPVTVTRADVHFNTRPWLLFNQLTLKDQTGKTIATKTISSASDATEITVGSDYLVRFDSVNYTVAPGADADLVVGATVLSATDKIPTGGMTVEVAFGSNGVRTENGVGYTDTLGTADLSATAGVGSNIFTLAANGSVADIYARISPSSPTAHQQTVSLTQTTSDVLLGTISLKSANNSSTLNSLTVAVAGTVGTSTALSNVRLFNGSTSYGGTWSGNSVVFNNLTLPLSQDVWNDYSIKADVTASSTGTVYVSLTSNTSNIVVTDANYNTATVEPNTVTSSTVTLTTNAVSVVNASATAVAVPGTTVTAYNANYQFGLTNTSNNDLYVSATGTTFVTTNANASSSLSTIQTALPSTLSGDVTGVAYIIPAGSTRTFTLVGAIRGTGTVTLRVNSIQYGTGSADGSNHGLQILTGLENLVQTVNF